MFAERDRAVRVAQIRHAIEESSTWGEFRRGLPAGEWEDRIQVYFDAAEEEPPVDDAPFTSDDVLGYGEGDYPEWLLQVQLEWFPKELIEKYGGNVGDTVHNGPPLDLPADKADAIAEDLRALGHTLERRVADYAGSYCHVFSHGLSVRCQPNGVNCDRP